MRSRSAPYLAALLAALLVSAAFLYFDRYERRIYYQELRADALHELHVVKSRLEFVVNSRLRPAEGLSAYVSIHPEITKDEFNSFAQRIMERQAGILKIELVKGTVITDYIYPLKGNEKVIGLDLMSMPHEREGVLRAIETKKTVVAGPVDLIPSGVAFISRSPVFIGSEKDSRQRDKYWGLAQALITTDSIFKEAGLYEKTPGFLFAIRGKDATGASGKVFFGDREIFQKDPVLLEVTIFSGSWQLAAVPVKGWTAVPKSLWILRTGGLILSVLIGILAWILVHNPIMLKEKVVQATKALIEAEQAMLRLKDEIETTERRRLERDFHDGVGQSMIKDNSSLENRVEECTCELRESEAPFRHLFERHRAVMLLIDHQSRIIIDANPAAAQFYGYPLESLRGMNVSRINAQPESEIHPQRQQAIIGERDRFVFDHRLANGAVRTVEIYISTVNYKGKSAFFSIIHDITERKRAEEALHRSETKFRTLFHSTSEAVVVLDEKGFFDCNKAALVMFGCATREEFCSKHPADLSPPLQPCGTDSLTLANRRIATAMEQGSLKIEWMCQRADTGKVFPADMLLSKMELDGRTVLQATIRDITERKKLEDAIETTERRRLARDLHDGVGQSLLALKLNLQMMKANKIQATEPAIEEIIKDVSNTTGEIRDIVMDLRPPFLETDDIMKALEQLSERMQEKSGMRITLAAEDNLAGLDYTVRYNIYRICQEFLNNAVKHSGADKAEIKFSVSDKELFLEMKDNGKGFDYREAKERQRGSGLSIMAERAELLKGSFNLKTAPGEGTSINIMVPIA